MDNRSHLRYQHEEMDLFLIDLCPDDLHGSVDMSVCP